MSPGLCAVCHREPRGFGWFDATYRFADPRRDFSRRRLCSRACQDIIEPCASIHGVSAPGPFWEALKSGSLQDGSLARFLVFRSDDDIPDRNRRPAPLSDLPPELLAAVQAVAAVGADQPRGNLAGIGAGRQARAADRTHGR